MRAVRGRFSGRGRAGGLSAKSLEKTLEGYGRWLGFLDHWGWLDRDAVPGDRPSEARVASCFDELRALGNRDHTITGRFQELRDALAIMAPDADFSWLTRPGGVPLRRRLAMEKRPIAVHHSADLLVWGLEMMQRATPARCARSSPACTQPGACRSARPPERPAWPPPPPSPLVPSPEWRSRTGVRPCPTGPAGPFSGLPRRRARSAGSVPRLPLPTTAVRPRSPTGEGFRATPGRFVRTRLVRRGRCAASRPEPVALDADWPVWSGRPSCYPWWSSGHPNSALTKLAVVLSAAKCCAAKLLRTRHAVSPVRRRHFVSGLIRVGF